MTPLGNKLGEWITLRGEDYPNDLAGKQYFVGREVLCWDVDGNFAGDTVDVGSVNRLRWGKKTAVDDLSVAFG